MKRLSIAGLILLICISGCGNGDNQDFYGIYTFNEVSYLSVLSSSSSDFINKMLAGTKYTIKKDLFSVKTTDNTFEISSPSYVKEEIPKNPPPLADVRTFIGNEVEDQYTIYNKDKDKTHLRLYVSSDCLWIASYADNTANGSEIIMDIFKLSK